MKCTGVRTGWGKDKVNARCVFEFGFKALFLSYTRNAISQKKVGRK